ncbi:MAG: bifunctional DNA-formamidopyrimidine glycosylase/DNA-(apurinic or apyrimidinic site) lyase [Pseudomonadota bacterium]|nr:bifunctional DNA-formamidopyrimidine glycosylase/DNA-(apurinic or apyrimidinic site) lyase [Pseudomonadota bacterium]
MPELPEVETTRRGIDRHITGQTISSVRVNNPNLRWPVPVSIMQSALPGCKIHSVKRRAKYLLLDCGTGSLIIHLGMSGSLRILDQTTIAEKHDHVEIMFDNGKVLRLQDPRRFGAVLWTEQPPDEHRLLSRLGPEPLSDDFDGNYLFKKTRKRSCSIKNLIMDAHIVAGVGNIYASEALFHAGIRPGKSAVGLTRQASHRLAAAIRQVLEKAIAAGGTSLQDFTNIEGQAGYFSQSLFVYGREAEPCLQCGTNVKRKLIGQRSSFYCPYCQK